MQEYFGRRWSHVTFLFLTAIFCGLASGIADHPPHDTFSMWTVNVLCFLSKFVCTGSFYIFYVQSIEMFPTCVRNSGLGLSAFISGLLTLPAPQVAHLGTIDRRIPYAVIAAIALFAAFTASLLPETLGSPLHETITSAAEFGKKQKYFSWIFTPQITKLERKKSVLVRRQSSRKKKNKNDTVVLLAPMASEESV